MAGHHNFQILAILMAILSFMSITILANVTLKNVSIDVTEDNLYTLSRATHNTLANIDEPIVIDFYVSPLLYEELPSLANYADRVRELLLRYSEIARGQLVLNIYRPGLFTVDEERAMEYGLQSIPVNVNGDPVFLGLAATNSTDDLQVIPFFSPDRERFLEYDLTKMIAALSNPQKPTVALIGTLPLNADPARQNRPWFVYEEIKEFFEIRRHDGIFSAIDDEFDIIFIALPGKLSEKELYAIDQYILGGGSALILIDPLPEMSIRSIYQLGEELDSGALEKLFGAWKLDVDVEHVVGDSQLAQRIRVRERGRDRAVRYLPWLALRGSSFNKDDVITRDVNQINMASAGSIELLEGAKVSISPLLSSSLQSMRIDVDRIQFPPDAFGLIDEFVSEERSFTMAARINGHVPSAFVSGPPLDPDGTLSDIFHNRLHRTESVAPINVVVVADTDILFDDLWAGAEQIGRDVQIRPFASNAQFILNALDSLHGSIGLVDLRSRGILSRPFQRLEAITRKAESRYRSSEKLLTEKLAETESRIRSARIDNSGAIVLTEKQFEILRELRGEADDIRNELRGVQLSLREDIERTKLWLTVVNIGAMPVVVICVALFLVVVGRAHPARREQKP
mgnify:CR=1 FL=1|tara:strand:+ start:245 stop:2122 length:1878 start_codon:yes stop_codon:yes gene_type:complete